MSEFQLSSFGEDFTRTIKRITDHSSVLGVIVIENQKDPVYTTMDNNKTFTFATRLRDLVELSDHVVHTLNPEDNLMVIRIQTSKYEIMNVLPTKQHSIVCIQQLDGSIKDGQSVFS